MNKETAIEIVCKERPVLKALFERSNEISIQEYYNTTQNTSLQPNTKLIEALVNVTRKRLGGADAHFLKEELSSSYRVGTADHHGPIGHPFFFHNAIIEHILNPERTLIILPCAGVSLGNSSFPRGLLLHDNTGALVRIPFFTSGERNEPVYGKRLSVERMKDIATTHIKKIRITDIQKEKLINVIDQILSKIENESLYEEIITHINKELWSQIVGESYPYIAIDQESIVVEYIRNPKSHNTDFVEILQDTVKIQQYINAYEKVIGAWDTAQHKGSHLFWFRGDKTRIPLWYKNGVLVNERENISITLSNTAELKRLLDNKKLYPTMTLSFTILTGFCGLRTDGGFSQINYLTEMMSLHKKLQKYDIFSETDIPETSVFRGELGVIPFEIGEKVVQATALDILLYAPNDWKRKVLHHVSNATLKEGLEAMLEEFYKITTGKMERIEDLKIPEPLWKYEEE